MDHALLVRRGERVRERDREVEHPRDRQAAGRHQVVERLAIDQLHGQEADALCLLDRMQDDDVRVAECGHALGLALEPREPIGIPGHVVRAHLERDVAPEPRVARAIDLAHAAGTEQRDDFIRSEGASGSERHSGKLPHSSTSKRTHPDDGS